MSPVLRSPSADDEAAMLALNNEFAVETSLLRAAGASDVKCTAI